LNDEANKDILPSVSSKKAANPKADESRKEAILAAAMKVFAKKGYGNTRIEDVAKEAKLSYGLAYYYFFSKDKLFHLVLQRALDSTMELYAKALRHPGTYQAKLRSLLADLLSPRFSPSDSPETLIMVQAFTHAGIPKVTRKLADTRMLEITAVLQTMIAGLQAEGHAVGKDSETLATMFNALRAGLAVIGISNQKAPTLDLDTILSFLA
jgi:AcrR family transcriptional regulator